jgi:hypothetical protein
MIRLDEHRFAVGQICSWNRPSGIAHPRRIRRYYLLLARKRHQPHYLMEELASHGCVVASLSHPYESLAIVFPDGRIAGLDLANPRLDAERPFAQLEAISRERSPWMEASLQLWAADMHCLLDEIERRNAAGAGEPWSGRLDVNRIGVLGVSFGGQRGRAGVPRRGALRGGHQH